MENQKYESYNNKLYKNKYLIALYDADDFCVGAFKNCREIADFLNKSIDSTFSSIGRCLEGKISCIHANDRERTRYTVYFTDLSNLDDISKDEYIYS